MADALSSIIRHRPQRVFRVTFYCDECTGVGSEFTDEMMVVGTSYCPCCDAECRPDGVEEFEEMRAEFTDGEGE